MRVNSYLFFFTSVKFMLLKFEKIKILEGFSRLRYAFTMHLWQIRKI